MTSVLGGLASTTASTLAFAKEVKERPDSLRTYWAATVVANAIQFPRILLILYVVSVQTAMRTVIVLLSMTVVGLVLGWLLYRMSKPAGEESSVRAGNPFRLAPALKFGALFAVIMFISRAAAAEFGGQGLFWASALGGTMDADAVSVSAASLFNSGSVSLDDAVWAILLALFMNAVLKSGLAAYAGGLRFGLRTFLGFLVMFGTGAILLLMRGLG